MNVLKTRTNTVTVGKKEKVIFQDLTLFYNKKSLFHLIGYQKNVVCPLFCPTKKIN